MPIMKPTDVAEEFRRRSLNVRALFEQSVRPIYKRQRSGQPELIGSSVLIQIGNQPCLATAAHVLRAAAGGSLWLAGSARLIQLGTEFDTTSLEGGKDDVDIAVAPLNRRELDELIGVPIIGGPNQTREPSSEREDFFIVMGFRASQNKASRPGTKVLKKRTVWTFTSNGAAVPRASERFDGGSYNFAVNFTKYGKRANGNKIKSTSPEGVSGGAIFHLGNVEGVRRSGSTSPQQPKLVGLLIECDGAVLIGTSLPAVYHVRRQSDPSVA